MYRQIVQTRDIESGIEKMYQQTERLRAGGQTDSDREIVSSRESGRKTQTDSGREIVSSRESGSQTDKR
jgi:hypothetical protein